MGDEWDTIISSAPASNSTSSAWDSSKGFSAGAGAGRGRGMKAAADDGGVGALANNMSNAKIDDDWGVGASTTNNNSNNNNDDWGNGSSSFGQSNNQPRSSGFGGPRRCNKCNEEGHMARDCPSGGGNRGCFKCKQEGHMSRDCPNASAGGGGSRACHKCGEEGHMSRECPNPGSGGGGGSRACYKCGEEGHMSRECPNPGSGGGGGNRGCFKCGQEGHISKDCTNPSSGNNNGGGGGRGCRKCGEDGHMARECPNNPSGGDEKPRGCFKCGDSGHMARDCTSTQTMDGPDGKPRENYIPQDEDENLLFEGSIKSGVNFNDFDNIPLQVTGQGVPDYITSFESAGLRPLLLDNIRSSGYAKPTPVQKGTIPAILLRRDVIACAQTGSGKTAAYLVPVINILLEAGCSGGLFNQTQSPEVVVMAPTRELAIQIHKEAMKFSHNSVLKTVLIYGGTNVQHQVTKVQTGCNILVSTPGRLKDLVERTYIDFSSVKCFILDEADRMLDLGFGKDIEAVVKHPTMPPTGKRQTLMFSATFPEDVQKLAWNYLDNYIFVNTGIIGGTNPHVCQEFFEVNRSDKRNKLTEVLANVGNARTIIFVESKKTADFVAAFLCNTQFQATSIHGDRLQSQREEALRDFRRGTRNILVATNVAARGLDIAGVEYVINFDLPQDVEEYVHRIGRTGRVGNIGKSISFFDPERDAPNAAKLVQKLSMSQAEVPSFLQSSAGGMGYVYNSGANSQFNSRDMRRFGGGDDGLVQKTPVEAEDSWD